MMNFRFGTAINCIDGRTQEVVIDHMKQNYYIDGVDMVTFPSYFVKSKGIGDLASCIAIA